jgi:Flp pilus assembly protein TadG
MWKHRNQQRALDLRRRRRGIIVSIELMLALPLLIILLCAVVEFSMLWSVNHLVKAASHAGCRVATLPAGHPAEREAAVRQAAAAALIRGRLVAAHQITFESGPFTGDPVMCEVRLPMNAAAPNMLAIFGFNLEGRELVARTMMRKE